MSPSAAASLVLLSAVLLLSSTGTSAFNISRILERYPDFSEFNSLLSKTGLVPEINRRMAVTVLALTNDRIGELAGKPEDVQKRLLSTHIILDYYDILKLNKLKDTKTTLTTLYQSTGTADDMQGFLDVIHRANGSIVFGSAMKGAPHDITLEGSVASQPYNVSVLSVSKPIFAPGIDGSYMPVTTPPPQPNANATTPASSVVPKPAESPEEVLADVPAPAEAPEVALAADAPADAPANAPDADASSADADDELSLNSPSSGAAGKYVISGVSLWLVASLVSIVMAQ